MCLSTNCSLESTQKCFKLLLGHFFNLVDVATSLVSETDHMVVGNGQMVYVMLLHTLICISMATRNPSNFNTDLNTVVSL